MLSSMDLFTRKPIYSAALLVSSALVSTSSVTTAQIIEPSARANAQQWDEARAQMLAKQPAQIASAIGRWEQLIGNDRLRFDDYAGFVLAYPGFPQEERLRMRAEGALDRETVAAQTLVAYFDRNPPRSNSAKARYALALAGMQRAEALEIARSAWRGGPMEATTEAYLAANFGGRFTAADQNARMDALLWHKDVPGARRQINNTTPEQRPLFEARLALIEGQSPADRGLLVPPLRLTDPGYVYNLVSYYRNTGQLVAAVNLLATRPAFQSIPNDQEDLIAEMLRVAQGADARSAQRIAASVDDVFAPSQDISTLSYRLRDDYTSLMWLGGTKALWEGGNALGAAPLFYRYGAAAQTPQTRSKGFYWAGLASARAGDRTESERYYAMAAAYPDRFYGQLALKELGRPIPPLRKVALAAPSAERRTEFAKAPLTRAVREVSRSAPWSTGIRFYREIAQSADTPEEHLLVADLAREIGRRDLAVNVLEAAGADGLDMFVETGFPTLTLPAGLDWTMAHAIARQESQFAANAISHAGARGLMQLMPGTAREQAGKLGLQYMSASLIEDPQYNLRLGTAYFARMLDYYDGAYPLAIAAYNAGPGNVNKWLRANGDPRTGAIDYLTWIERIPFFETKNYVQRVIENAAVYEQLYPNQARRVAPRTVSDFLER